MYATRLAEPPSAGRCLVELGELRQQGEVVLILSSEVTIRDVVFRGGCPQGRSGTYHAVVVSSDALEAVQYLASLAVAR